jgi:hypothetical protein
MACSYSTSYSDGLKRYLPKFLVLIIAYKSLESQMSLAHIITNSIKTKYSIAIGFVESYKDQSWLFRIVKDSIRVSNPASNRWPIIYIIYNITSTLMLILLPCSNI